MSGNVPSWSRASQAVGGWRNKSHALDGTGPGGVNLDLSGGWYDAGGKRKAAQMSTIKASGGDLRMLLASLTTYVFVVPRFYPSCACLMSVRLDAHQMRPWPSPTHA